MMPLLADAGVGASGGEGGGHPRGWVSQREGACELRGRGLQYCGMGSGMRIRRKSLTTIESIGNSVCENLGTADRRCAEFRIQFGKFSSDAGVYRQVGDKGTPSFT